MRDWLTCCWMMRSKAMAVRVDRGSKESKAAMLRSSLRALPKRWTRNAAAEGAAVTAGCGQGGSLTRGMDASSRALASLSSSWGILIVSRCNALNED